MQRVRLCCNSIVALTACNASRFRAPSAAPGSAGALPSRNAN